MVDVRSWKQRYGKPDDAQLQRNRVSLRQRLSPMSLTGRVQKLAERVARRVGERTAP